MSNYDQRRCHTCKNTNIRTNEAQVVLGALAMMMHWRPQPRSNCTIIWLSCPSYRDGRFVDRL